MSDDKRKALETVFALFDKQMMEDFLKVAGEYYVKAFVKPEDVERFLNIQHNPDVIADCPVCKTRFGV